MSFGSSKPPQEDPAVKAARDRQQQLADNALSLELQNDLRRRTRLQLQRFGGATPASSLGAMKGIFSGASPAGG